MYSHVRGRAVLVAGVDPQHFGSTACRCTHAGRSGHGKIQLEIVVSEMVGGCFVQAET